MYKLLDDFQDYIVSIDPLGRCRRLSSYTQIYLTKTFKEVGDHEGKLFVAENDGVLVSFIAGVVIEKDPEDKHEVVMDKVGRVIELYVDGKFRRQGVGKQLMTKMEDYLREIGCTHVWVEVFAPYQMVRDLYQRNGY